MSSFVKYNMRSIRNREILIAALKSLGIDVDPSDVHAEPVTILDFHGHAQQVNIVIRRKAGAYNPVTQTGMTNVFSDWGMRQEEDKTWSPVVDNLSSYHAKGKAQPVHQAVAGAYGRINGDRARSRLLTHTIAKMKESGAIGENAVVTSKMVNGKRQLLAAW